MITQKIRWSIVALLPLAFALCLGMLIFIQRFHRSINVQVGIPLGDADITEPAPLAAWPWQDIKKETLSKGVTHWQASSVDGTTADLFEFDWRANPEMRIEIFDQDEDDDTPFDNKVKYWNLGVGEATRQLNQNGRGQVLAVWNGLFFGYLTPEVTSPSSVGFHVSPVVLKGKVHFNTANHRWAFGVKNTPEGPVWKKAHLPSRAWLEENLDWGGGSAQCIVNDGQPTALQPFPAPGATPLPQPVKSTPSDAGHIPIFDHMRTCRVSMAWTADNKRFYLLFIKEADGEKASELALKYRRPLEGGWTVPDVQRFCLKFQATALKPEDRLTAMNSDAGDVAQMTYLRKDGDYMLIPPRSAKTVFDRKTFEPDLEGAPVGGAIMYFYVRDGSEGAGRTTPVGTPVG
jgi:hypothetical protein